MTTHSDSHSHSQPFIRTLLTTALTFLLVMISVGVSPTWQAAIPAISVWITLALSYGAWRMIRTSSLTHRAI